MPVSAPDTGIRAVSASFEALPLFPLRTVLFPGGRLALKVFEARYLDLVSRCLRQSQAFGVISLSQGAEAGPQQAERVRIESVGVLAGIDTVDGEQAGILKVTCTGLQRFRLLGAPSQAADGLWSAPAEPMADDAPEPPPPDLQASAEALARAVERLKVQGHDVVPAPLRLDDAGWVANRWCELLPVSLAAKQKLMALEDPVIRLSLVDGYLRDKKVVVG